MLSFRKIILAALFSISACGFSPVYTTQNNFKLAEKISIQEPKTQNEFIFYSRLTNRFNEGNGEYILKYAITTSKKDSGLNFDGTDHRVEISGIATYSIKDAETGLEVLSDKEEIYLSYSNFGSTAAVLNADRITLEQLVILLADKVADKTSLIIAEKNS